MKISYRPEIDGLRAIAVGVIILYHAQITIFGYQIFKGGFIGVDIFFVISGYLITSIILKELVTTGSFSFKHFYERRIRRILPALLVVMLASIPFAWIYLLPTSFIDFSESILYSLGFSSNFYFHYSGQTYSAESGLFKPFLHTWSLSIEEQYYILFPVVLLITFKYLKKYLLIIIIIGLIISLQAADWGSRNYTSATFYFLHTRMWELLAGSMLASLEIILGHCSRIQTLNLILPSIGLLLIGHSVLFFNDKMFHPSFFTLSPIIGVCLIMWFSNSNELITKLLSTRLFVGIGLISYSLYLWHYPIFAFARITDFTQGNLFKQISLGIIILMLSIISYYFIERPARSRKNKVQIIINLVIIAVCILVFCNIYIIKNEGLKSRLPEIIKKNLTEVPWNILKNTDGKTCFNNTEGCRFNTSSNKKIYIIGDSHMETLTFNLKDRVIENDYQFITSTIGACLYFPDFNLVDKKTQKISEVCNDNYFKKIKKTLLKESNSIIVIGGRLPLYSSNYRFDNQEGGKEGEEWEESQYISLGKYETILSSYKSELSKLSKKNKLILIYPIPEAGWNVPNKLNIYFSNPPKNVYKIINNFEFISTSYQVYKNRTKSSFELLDSIKNDNIYRVYPHTLFCDTVIKDRCVNHDNKNTFYADDDHPSYKGAEMINDLIMKKIKIIELKSN